MVVTEEDRLKEEIRVVKEVIAQMETRKQVGYSNWRELEKEVSIPPRFEHLLDQNMDKLKQHLERLKADLTDLHRLPDDQNGFQDDVEYHRGRRLNQDDEDDEI